MVIVANLSASLIVDQTGEQQIGTAGGIALDDYFMPAPSVHVLNIVGDKIADVRVDVGE